MTPDQINQQAPGSYACRNCRATSGLHWFGGTSCPVCSKPECTAALDEELRQDIEYDAAMDILYRERYGA